MELYFLSILAGILTVASPCVLPILPVVLAGSSSEKDKRAPYVMIASLALSVFLFTILLKGTTVLIGVPDSVWLYVSGGIVIFIGISFLFPNIWEQISVLLKLQQTSAKISQSSQGRSGIAKSALLGLSLGPIFTSCSPTYGLILATVLPVSFAEGSIYIAGYTIGLSIVLLLIALGGRNITAKLGWLADPKGKARRILGVILILTGLLIATGYIKDIEAWLVGKGFIGTSSLERGLID